MTDYFVTRHSGAREWARRRGIKADVTAHFEPEVLRDGDRVMGTLPVNVAAEVCRRGGRYLHLTLELPPEARGRDLTADEMDRYGARLEEFLVRSTTASNI